MAKFPEGEDESYGMRLQGNQTPPALGGSPRRPPGSIGDRHQGDPPDGKEHGQAPSGHSERETRRKVEIMKLTSKQEAFAQHYALHGSAVEAYKSAGYSWKQMKNETIHRKAVEVLQNGKVAARIAELQDRVVRIAEEKFDLTADAILLQYQRIAFADAGDFYEWDGQTAKPKTFDKLTKEQRQIICGIKQSRGNTNSIEMVLADRMRALDVLAKHLGIGKETVKHEHTFVDDAATDFDSRLAGLVTRATAAGDSRQLN